MSEDLCRGRPPVPVSEVCVECIGINPLDRQRVDVAVDLTPCLQAVDVEVVIVGPDDEELCSVLMIQNREWMLDRVMHLRREAQAGEHTLHVGVFCQGALIARAARKFAFLSPQPE